MAYVCTLMGASTSSWDRRWVIPQFSIIAVTYAQLTNVRVWPPHETCSNTMKTNLNVSNINDCQLVAVVLSKWLPRGLISAPRFYCLNPQHILVLNNYSWQFNKTSDNQLLTAGLAKCHVDIFFILKVRWIEIKLWSKWAFWNGLSQYKRNPLIHFGLL